MDGRLPPSARTSEQRTEDLLVGRESADRVLREQGAAVDHHVEHAVAALLQRGLDTGLLLDFGGQTGRPGEVVSDDAVGDHDGHGV